MLFTIKINVGGMEVTIRCLNGKTNIIATFHPSSSMDNAENVTELEQSIVME